jgi:hypothetical protein
MVTGRRFSLAAATLAALAVQVAPAVAATVTLKNYSFEEDATGPNQGQVTGVRFGDLTTSPTASWNIYSGLKDWSTTSGTGVEVQTNRTLSTIDAQNGQYYVELDGTRNAAISQTVKLKQGTYVLSFWYSPRTAFAATNIIGYNLGRAVSGQITAGMNGARVGIWTEVRTRFTLASKSNLDLTFAALGFSDGTGGLIDNVAIQTVPIPAAGIGFFTALCGLAAIARRRRA